MVSKFKSYLVQYDFVDLLDRQIDYALNLINFEGELEYEDIHKLFILCDEIEALRRLELNMDTRLYQSYQSSFREWFNKEPKLARIAASHIVEDWKRDWWWYREILEDNGDSSVGRKRPKSR